MLKSFFAAINRISLVKQIVVALLLGFAFAYFSPENTASVKILGDFFVTALKSVAPILVFVLVLSAIAGHRAGEETNIKDILIMYLVGTFLAALTAVIFSFAAPTTLLLEGTEDASGAPQKLGAVLFSLVMKLVDNPISAIADGNYVGILAWAILLGLAFRQAEESTRKMLANLSDAVSFVVRVVIKLAPLGIFGLVSSTLASTGFRAFFESYGQLLIVLLGAMVFVALIVNPLLVFWKIKRNPYPLVFTCLRESGITAFFTRSSAANIPVNMNLCRKLGLDENTYSISIPLGATINMAGAAITITVMALAAAHTLHIEVSFIQALLLSLVASLSACGASGVAGGSLLLIPLACSLFNIDNEIAAQVIAVGVVIGVLQDSAETGLNSSTDVLFTAAAELGKKS